METKIVAILSVLAISLLSFVGLAFSSKRINTGKAVPILVALAIGVMTGGAFFHLLPESFEHAENKWVVIGVTILGLLLFGLIERIIHLRQGHHHQHVHNCEKCEKVEQIKPVGYMNLLGDGMHNFMDGVIIGAAFMVNLTTGFITTVAVAFHEIAQEAGDFGVLLHAGFSRARALFFNFLSALVAILGAILVFYVTFPEEYSEVYIPAFTAGAFIYIAVFNLLPELGGKKIRISKRQVAVLVALGFLIAYGSSLFEGLFIEH